ncbi:MAG: ATP-binding cassette domain-containing protein, partial [Candidatus Promineofilum sp.]|nr:ATP-binding cassette domain-containing protein [Promineifilum sp.]
RLGVLTDSHGLYLRLTARENIRYFGRLHGLSGKELEQLIDTLIELLDMAEIANRRTEGFSTGEQVKVAIARSLVHRPQNVMLDEPTAGLDVMSTRAMRGVIRQLRDEGRCILFSSHVMQEVAMLCENIVIIAGGRVAAQGSPDELRQRTGQENLEDAFVDLIGTKEGLI